MTQATPLYLTKTANDQFQLPTPLFFEAVIGSSSIYFIALSALSYYSLGTFKAGMVGLGVGTIIDYFVISRASNTLYNFSSKTENQQMEILNSPEGRLIHKAMDSFNLKKINPQMGSSGPSPKALALTGLLLIAIPGCSIALRRFSLLPNFAIHTAQFFLSYTASVAAVDMLLYRPLYRKISVINVVK